VGRKYDEEQLHWKVPRPPYVREIEPLAHPAAWPSQDPAAHVDPKEQELNRQIFIEGRKRNVRPTAGEERLHGLVQKMHDEQKKAG
jgi:hypothetical protein